MQHTRDATHCDATPASSVFTASVLSCAFKSRNPVFVHHECYQDRPVWLPVLTAEAMREADRLTIESLGIPGFTLMETAGRASARVIEKKVGNLKNKHVLCFCGKGNNGGDGYVAARVLAARGARVTVVSMAAPDRMTEDAARNFKLLEELASNETEASVTLHRFDNVDRLEGGHPVDIIVDALLGTGIQSALRPPFDTLIAWINEHPAWTVAMDIPSGLHADTGIPLGQAVRADCTVSMGALKAGQLLGQGSQHTGAVHVADIGIPAYLLRRAASAEGCGRLPTRALIRNWMPRRPLQTHKYDVGMALVVAGSTGLTGAARLASLSAERAGAGAVVCATPDSVQPILDAALTEVMTVPLPASDLGIQPEPAIQALTPRLSKARAVLIGCGLGADTNTQRFVRTLLQRVEQQLVLDADGLNAVAGHTELLETHANGRWILTPHIGEFKRLAGESVDLDHNIATVRAYARRWNCVLILKGNPSLVGDPSGAVYVNPTGNNGLATAGTGDVLAGYCAGLLAQGTSPLKAALCALFVGGDAAEHYARQYPSSSMLAGDLIESIRAVLPDYYSS